MTPCGDLGVTTDGVGGRVMGLYFPAEPNPDYELLGLIIKLYICPHMKCIYHAQKYQIY